MKLALHKGDGEFFKFTNEGLKVGDQVYPLISGWSHNGEFYFVPCDTHKDEFLMLAGTGWHPDPELREPHTIKSFEHPVEEPPRIRTDEGYGPDVVYFKEIP
jgi:hypothetical protein